MVRMSATEVARRFSDVLNRVSSGEEIEITRAGAPVAVIAPPAAKLLSAEGFRALLASAPSADERFADDLHAIRRSAGPPDSRIWQS